MGSLRARLRRLSRQFSPFVAGVFLSSAAACDTASTDDGSDGYTDSCHNCYSCYSYSCYGYSAYSAYSCYSCAWSSYDYGEYNPPDEVPPEEPVCNTEEDSTLYLSADDSNSMAGPVIARQQVRDDGRFTGPIRAWEFLNYYNFDYEAAEAGRVRVTAQMMPNDDEHPDFDAGQLYDLQIGVRSHDIDPAERRPVNLTLSLDCSGSMGGHPMQMVRQSCLAIASSLRAGDIVSMVTWDSRQSILLESHLITGPDDPVLVDACRAINSGGSTDLEAGLRTAYDLARENYSSSRINRVILMSDGGANTGVTSETLIGAAADDAEDEAIYLIGVGMAESGYGYRDYLMDAITDLGKGAYVFIDSAEEAQRMFGDRFLSNIELAVRNVRVELTMPPTFDMVEFHGEEVSEDPAEVEPQHLAPNDAMIYHQIIGSCEPDLVDGDAVVSVTVTYETPFTREERSETIEMTLDELLSGENDQLVKGNAIIAYTQALEAAQSLEGEERLVEIDAARGVVSAALERLGDDPDLVEIADLIERLTPR